MVGAIRVVSVERGHDPRDFSLLALRRGWAAARRRARPRCSAFTTIVVPPAPGVLSALGLLVSSLKAEFTRTCLQKAGAFDAAEVARACFRGLDREARAWLDPGGGLGRGRAALFGTPACATSTKASSSSSRGAATR